MALRHLVEGECGAANPLVQWTSHFTQDKPMLQGGLEQDRLAELSRGDPQAEQMVNEFLGEAAVPQTFQMGSLLHQIQSSPAHDSSKLNEWVSEFSLPVSTDSGWVQEFKSASHHSERVAQDWVYEFQQQSVQQVARDITENVSDPDLQATEFMEFVRKMATGEAQLSGQETEKSWTEEFQEQSKPSNGGFWSQLEQEWTEASKAETHPWLSEFEHGETVCDYQFQEENPLKDSNDPLTEGLRKRSEGDLPTAVLLFEAEVQARPHSVQGWLYLGITQADNEQDGAAIAALLNCLSQEPGNLEAHLALAVSYTNESQQKKALDELRAWIQHNPKYAELAPLYLPLQQDKAFTGSFMSREEHTGVKDLYLAAAQSSPEEIDYNVQVGLGVLFNLSHEYNKAVDCFSAALDTRPNDAMLWNKLGATLANGNRSEEAVSAYRKALEISPGFTRCRYNLGVSCINLGAHKEAVEHLLTALNLQRQARGPHGRRMHMSESIWSTLRLAVTFLGRQTDLHKLIEEHDLDSLIKEFGV